MKKLATYLFFAVLLLPLSSFNVSASGGAGLEHSGANIKDTASLQRGAKWFVNYCMGCHTISYMRYNRLAEDLGLSEEMVMENLVFGELVFGGSYSRAPSFLLRLSFLSAGARGLRDLRSSTERPTHVIIHESPVLPTWPKSGEQRRVS